MSTPSTVPATSRNSAALLPTHDCTVAPTPRVLTASTRSPSSRFLKGLARDTQRRVGQRLEPGEPDLSATTFAPPERLGLPVQLPQRCVDRGQTASLLAREQERLLPLHHVRALLGRVEGEDVPLHPRPIPCGVHELLGEARQLPHRSLSILEQELLQSAQLVLAEPHGSSSSGLRYPASGESCDRQPEVHRPTVDLHVAGEREPSLRPRAAALPRRLRIPRRCREGYGPAPRGPPAAARPGCGGPAPGRAAPSSGRGPAADPTRARSRHRSPGRGRRAPPA